jgi:integrase
VAIPIELARELEELRLLSPTQVVDREICYLSVYDIGGGHAFSESVSAASKRALGHSNGAHGFRHTYAQNRLLCMKRNGLKTSDALLILSQELGHFRPEICLAYLR